MHRLLVSPLYSSRNLEAGAYDNNAVWWCEEYLPHAVIGLWICRCSTSLSIVRIILAGLNLGS